MQKYTTVIEITSQYLKLIAVKLSLKEPQIVNLTVRPVASISAEGLTGEVTVLIKGLKFIPSPLIVSFPRNLITMRNLHLPSNDAKEIQGMIDLHMGRQVPYPREEIIGSYQILGTDETGYSKVILAIAHRDALRHVFNLLNNVNLFPEKVELSSQGVFSWFLFNRKAHLKAGEIYMLLDIDSNFTDFMIIDKDNLIFSRSIAVGAEQIAVAQIRQTKFISELKQSLVIFQSEEMNKKPSKIFISGAIDDIDDLIKLLETELGVEVEAVKPSLNLSMPIPKNVSVSSISGLALDTRQKRINFILPEVQIRKALKERSKEIILLGTLLIFIFMASCGIFLERSYNRSSYLKLLNTRYQEVSDDVERLDTMSKKIKVVRERLDSRALNLNYLYQINKRLPPEIVIKMITLEAEDKITLRGQAQAMSDVFKFITALENSNYFKDIQVKYTTKKKIGDQDITEFEIACPTTLTKK